MIEHAIAEMYTSMYTRSSAPTLNSVHRNSTRPANTPISDKMPSHAHGTASNEITSGTRTGTHGERMPAER
eukprot:2545069-Rhodomonas_salina.1